MPDGATLVLPAENGLPSHAVDEWVHAALGELPAPARVLAALVTHELLANARRSWSAPYVVRLTALDRRGTLAVLVDDCTPAEREAEPDPNLALVAALSTRWGVEQRRYGRTTWAELSVDRGTS
jgi:hypothetical protein